MNGLDTNVLVRYIAQDDERQAAAANHAIGALSEADPGFVTLIALAEIWWVLTGAYSTERREVIAVIERLTESKEIVVEHIDTVRRSLLSARRGADFADALIKERGVDAGCERTLTFDSKAAKRAGMDLLTTS